MASVFEAAMREWRRSAAKGLLASTEFKAGLKERIERDFGDYIFSTIITKSVVVSEAGASVYSASDVAREEFPDYDVTVRGAVSIGRRLTDPLAELVKIDPKAIGVGPDDRERDQRRLIGLCHRDDLTRVGDGERLIPGPLQVPRNAIHHLLVRFGNQDLFA